MNLTKTQKLGLFAIPVLIGVYLIYRQFRKPKLTQRDIQQKQAAINEVKNTPKSIPNPTPSCSYPLKKGLYNCTLVKELQKALNAYPEPVISRLGTNKVLSPLIEDGDFGAKTEEFLMSLTSELAINKNSTKVTYTWTTIPDEASFNKLIDEIIQAVDDSQPFYPGVTPLPPAEPCNPLYQICY